jgi:mono/diheme cytochrome c family protein
MPRERPTPPAFESSELERSLDRYLVAGLVFMVLLIAGFITYKVREPTLRSDAAAEQQSTYSELGNELFATSCASCHGKGANGGSAPVLNAKEFLKSTTDGQIEAIIGGGVSGSDMSAWSQAYGGTLTDEQVRQITTYLRSQEADAPSVPSWRNGKS